MEENENKITHNKLFLKTNETLLNQLQAFKSNPNIQLYEGYTEEEIKTELRRRIG